MFSSNRVPSGRAGGHVGAAGAGVGAERQQAARSGRAAAVQPRQRGHRALALGSRGTAAQRGLWKGTHTFVILNTYKTGTILILLYCLCFRT